MGDALIEILAEMKAILDEDRNWTEAEYPRYLRSEAAYKLRSLLRSADDLAAPNECYALKHDIARHVQMNTDLVQKVEELRKALHALLADFYEVMEHEQADNPLDPDCRGNPNVMTARRLLDMPPLPPVFCFFCNRNYDEPHESCPAQLHQSCGPFYRADDRAMAKWRNW